jgi:hypothetical protein
MIGERTSSDNRINEKNLMFMVQSDLGIKPSLLLGHEHVDRPVRNSTGLYSLAGFMNVDLP